MQECVAAQNICYADLPTSAAVIGALKSGKTLRIDIVQPPKSSYSFPLAGYAAMVDSKGMTVTQYQQDLQRRADEARKRLEEQARPRR